jgi:adenine phosphoribosyltransferase
MDCEHIQPVPTHDQPLPGRSVNRIVVGTQSDLKKKVVLECLKETIFWANIEPEWVCCDGSGNPEQPVNSGQRCAERRMKKIRDGDAAKTTPSTLYIAIENGIETENVAIKGLNNLKQDASKPKRIVDVCYVVLCHGAEKFVSPSIPIDCSPEYFYKAMETSTDGFEFAADGFPQTMGTMIHNDHPDIPSTNWMSSPKFSSVSRETQMHGAIRTGLIKNLIAENVAYFKDFPLPGVIFKDLSYVLNEPNLLNFLFEGITYDIQRLGWDKKCDQVAGLDARGFIYGPMIAYGICKGFIMIRKKGKLPGDKITCNYETEYSNCDIEIMKETIKPGENIIVVDDLQATGGTMMGAVELLRAGGANVVGTYSVLEVPALREVFKKKIGDVPWACFI